MKLHKKVDKKNLVNSNSITLIIKLRLIFIINYYISNMYVLLYKIKIPI